MSSTMIPREVYRAKAAGLVVMRDLLCQRRWWKSSELAERLGAHPRTVVRWMVDMEAIGFPVVQEGAGPSTRYRGME